MTHKLHSCALRKLILQLLKGTVIILCSYNFVSATAQSNRIDSLDRLLKTTTIDTPRINLILAKANIYFKTNLDSALKTGNQALQESVKAKYRSGEALSRQILGFAYSYTGSFDSANTSLHLAEAIFRTSANPAALGKLYNAGFGIMYGMQGKYDSAKINFEKSIPYFRQAGDELSISMAYQNIAISYQQTSNLKIALSYLQKALAIMEKLHNTKDQSSILINMGNTYQHIGDTVRSEKCFLQAIDIAKNARLMREEMYGYSNLSSLYSSMNNIFPAYESAVIAARIAHAMRDKGMEATNLAKAAMSMGLQHNYEKANDLAKQAIAIADSSQQPFNINQAYGTMGKILNSEGKYKAAVPYFEKGIFAVRNSDLYSVDYAADFKELSLAYEKTGAYEKALQAYKKAEQISDSALNEENIRKTTELSMNFDYDKRQQLARLEQQKKEGVAQTRQIILSVGLLFSLLLFVISLFAYRSKQKAMKIIAREKQRSEELLLNILPEEVATELKNHGRSEAKGFDLVTVMFADIKEFTKIGEQLSPQELVQELDFYFRGFDKIVEGFGIEKIKTIGDAYLCAGGLPVSNSTHAVDVVNAAVEMRQFLLKIQKEKFESKQLYFEFRIGIHTGPVVAGIVGVKKFAYDIWGDAVNTAARMEQSSEPGKINISGETYTLVKDRFPCTYRGKISVKHKRDMDMYFVEDVPAG